MYTIAEKKELTVEEFIKLVTQARLQAKGKKCWYQWLGEVQGKAIRLKGYGTWLQIFDVDGIKYGTTMTLKVSEFNEALQEPFK